MANEKIVNGLFTISAFACDFFHVSAWCEQALKTRSWLILRANGEVTTLKFNDYFSHEDR